MKAFALLLSLPALLLTPSITPQPGPQASKPSKVAPKANFSTHVTLQSMRDRYRLLLVFAPTDQDPHFLEQVKLFAAMGPASSERDLLFFSLAARSVRTSWDQLLGYPGAGRLSRSNAAATRRRFKVPTQSFTVILLGKDGGEKLRSQTALSGETLIRTIDAMPMRQEEMQKRVHGTKTP